jgi:hypothetical protein
MEEVPGAKCSQKILENFFGSKIRYLDREKYPRKICFDFFFYDFLGT